MEHTPDHDLLTLMTGVCTYLRTTRYRPVYTLRCNPIPYGQPHGASAGTRHRHRRTHSESEYSTSLSVACSFAAATVAAEGTRELDGCDGAGRAAPRGRLPSDGVRNVMLRSRFRLSS